MLSAVARDSVRLLQRQLADQNRKEIDAWNSRFLQEAAVAIKRLESMGYTHEELLRSPAAVQVRQLW